MFDSLTSRQTDEKEYTSEAVVIPGSTSGNKLEYRSSGACHLMEPLPLKEDVVDVLNLESEIRDKPKSASLGEPLSSIRTFVCMSHVRVRAT